MADAFTPDAIKLLFAFASVLGVVMELKIDQIIKKIIPNSIT